MIFKRAKNLTNEKERSRILILMTNARLLTVLALFLFAIIFIDTAVTKKLTKNTTETKEKKEVLGEQNKTLLSPTPQESNDSASNIPSPTNTPTATPIPPTPTHITTNQNFIYPGMVKISDDGGMQNFESSDDPTVITNWYKEKIRESGMNAKTFVTTNTNGNILNKLAGSNGTTNMSVEIEKRGSSKTIVRVRIS